MATLLHARNLAKTYGTHTLFRNVAVSLADGDRVGVVGPNGSGKSTLLKILAGHEPPDEGELGGKRQLRAAYIPQDDRFAEGATPRSAVVDALGGRRPEDGIDPETRAAITLGKLGFREADLERPVADLSGGWRKRLGIARGLVHDPDVLLLDEPTNHLDLEGMLWLEGFVPRAAAASIFVTHDRTFLDRVANRIVELSRAHPDGTLDVRGNYTEFCRRKEEALAAQAAQQAALANRVRQDTAWLKQGVQGRQTRNKAQLDAAGERREALASIKERNAAPQRTAAIAFQGTERKTKKLIAAHHIGKALGGKPLFSDVELVLSPGDRLGLLGPNGSGKTTLLACLAGELEPEKGSVKPAENLRLVRFTQHREKLDPTRTLREALCPHGDTVEYRGKPIHFAAWAKKFLFEPGQFPTPVGDLSGGEQARVQIARLMLEPADVLILDEPTNDLDIASLEVLEQSLDEFPGAVVLVTHDRFMLRNLATELLALDGAGGHRFYADYEQWERDASSAAEPAKKRGSGKREASDRSGGKASATGRASGGKLTYKLRHELEHMEAWILEAEQRVADLEKDAADPDVVADPARHAEACRALGEAQQEVDRLYERWAELEKMREQARG